MSVRARSESLGKTWDLGPGDLLRLFRSVGSLPDDNLLPATLQQIADQLADLCPIDRCIFLIVIPDTGDSDGLTVKVAAQQQSSGLNSLGQRQYQLRSNSETVRLLLAGKSVPLIDIMPPSPLTGPEDEWDRFTGDTESKSVVAFPIVAQNKLVGVLSLHHCDAPDVFPDQSLELGEALAKELATAVERDRSVHQREADSLLLRNIAAPALLLDRDSARIRRVNEAASKILAGARKELNGLPLVQVVPDGQRILVACSELCARLPVISLSGVLVNTSEGRPVYMDACISLLQEEGHDDLCILFTPTLRTKGDDTDRGDQKNSGRADELANTLTRQLSWERWVRQIICKMHATLDRDTLLQCVVDGFGRALTASRCLIVRTDGPASPTVTHEYVEADISPLGLGRTGQFPTAAVSFFKQKSRSVPDLAALEKSGDLSSEDYEYFADNGIRSMAGAPMTCHGIAYGVMIILESNSGRRWTAHELDMLEVVGTQTAVALSHSQSYLQLKDQLFNMNLLGNLAQQLTNTLELVSKAGKFEPAEDKTRQGGNTPPLSLRELEVLKLIAAGLANREIAQRLFLTESTVELHASRIRKKLKLKSRTGLVKYACDNGLA